MSAAGRPTPNAASASVPGRALALVSAVLGAAVAIELLVLRLGSRIAVHVPAPDAAAGPYEATTLAGRYAFHLAVASLLAMLVLVAWRAVAFRDARRVLVVAAALLFITGAGLARADAGSFLLTTALLVGAVMAAGFAAVAGSWRLAPCVGPLCMAAWLGGSYSVFQDAGTTGSMVRALPAVSEVAVIAAAIAAPIVFRVRRDRLVLVAGATVGVLVLLAFLVNPWTTRILLLWTDGLPGRMPGVAYAAAAAAYAGACASLGRRRQLETAVALGLLLAAGVGFQNTYQTGLMVAGLALLACAPGLASAAGSRAAAAPLPATPGPDELPVYSR